MEQIDKMQTPLKITYGANQFVLLFYEILMEVAEHLLKETVKAIKENRM
jgi:hypothetical protein